MSEFTEFLAGTAKRFKTKQEFARAIGITPGRFSRLLRGEFSMDVVNCLKLAKISAESPSRVLRLAGKGELADLVEELYGAAPERLTPDRREVIELWEAIPEEMRDAFEVMLRYTRDLAAASGPPRTGAPAASRARRRRATRRRAARSE